MAEWLETLLIAVGAVAGGVGLGALLIWSECRMVVCGG